MAMSGACARTLGSSSSASPACADDLEAGVLEQARHALAQQDRVLGDDDADARAEPELGRVGAQRGEEAAAELVDPLRLVEAAQAMEAEVAQAVGVAQRRVARLREQHLAAVTRGADPGGAVDVEPDVAALDAESARRCGCRCARARRRRGRAGSRAPPRPRRSASANAAENSSPWQSTSSPPAAARRGAHLRRCSSRAAGIRVAELLHEPRRALDVREQEGDAHRPSVRPCRPIARRDESRAAAIKL